MLCGDWNIAHQPIDLTNWRSNQKNSGFLPEERAWLSRVFDESGFVDVFRASTRDPDQYTWWSNRGAAWAKNVGWRIDYQIATPGIASKARAASIYKTRRFSDHAPLIIDYDYAHSARAVVRDVPQSVRSDHELRIDGYVLPFQVKKSYWRARKRNVWRRARQRWLRRKSLADDDETGYHTSFPQSVKLKAGEIVVFAVRRSTSLASDRRPGEREGDEGSAARRRAST